MQQMVAPESDANSGSGPQCHEEQGLAHDHTDDSDAIGAKGHANANLPGPLFDQVAEQPVETGEGDEQREAAKNAHDACSQFLRTDGVFHGFRHGGEFADSEMGVDFSDLATQLGNHCAGGNFNADGKFHIFADDRQVEWIIPCYLAESEVSICSRTCICTPSLVRVSCQRPLNPGVMTNGDGEGPLLSSGRRHSGK